MNAMIFAAGHGSRLAPLTDNCPKALLSVGHMPMIEHAITMLRDCVGVNRVVINVHTHADKIEIWARENAERLAVEIVLSDERDCLLDTGGGLLKAENLLVKDEDILEPIVLYNADILTDINLREMVVNHKQSGACATLLTSDRKTSRKLLFDLSGRMRGWLNSETGDTKPPVIHDVNKLNSLAFGGIHVVDRSVFKHLHDYADEVGQIFSITSFYTAVCNCMKIMSWKQPIGTRWIDAGKPESYAEANRLWC